MSTNIIYYDYNIGKNAYTKQYYNDVEKSNIEDKYGKNVKEEYKTTIRKSVDAIDLSNKILNRFGGIPERITIALGIDVSEMNNLDTVNLNVKIGERERQFSKVNSWVILGVDPAQDVLYLEEF